METNEIIKDWSEKNRQRERRIKDILNSAEKISNNEFAKCKGCGITWRRFDLDCFPPFDNCISFEHGHYCNDCLDESDMDEEEIIKSDRIVLKRMNRDVSELKVQVLKLMAEKQNQPKQLD